MIEWLNTPIDWWWVVLAPALTIPIGIVLAQFLPMPGAKRHRVEMEAHQAYMRGGGYPSYNEVYRRHGMVPKGGFK